MRRGLLLITVASATLLNPLNSSMIAVVLPSIGEEFRLSFAQVSWLVSVFYLASAVAQPVAGRLGISTAGGASSSPVWHSSAPPAS